MTERWWTLYQTVEERIALLERIHQIRKKELEQASEADKLSQTLALHDINTEIFTYKSFKAEMEALEDGASNRKSDRHAVEVDR